MFITINLNIVLAFAFAYYIIGVISILLAVAYQAREYKLKRKQVTRGILMAFIAAPIFPYLFIQDYRDRKNSKRVLARYQAERAAEREANIYA